MALRSHGTRLRAGSLTATYLPADHPELRVGFALPKTLGTAVVRNRLRRRLRAGLTDLVAHADPAVPGGALVISARRPAVEHTFWTLRADLHRLLDQVAAA